MPATRWLAKELIDQGNYINLLIIKPFKAGAKEQKDLLISIDSCPIGRCDNGSPPLDKVNKILA